MKTDMHLDDIDDVRLDHSIARAVNIHRIRQDFIDAMQFAWCREVCWPGCLDTYPESREDNPSSGACLVTVLHIWADHNFKDELVPGLMHIPGRDLGVWHFRMRIDGEDVDPTWQQAPAGTTFEETGPDHPFYPIIMTGCFFEDETLEPRLRILLEKMVRHGFKPEPHHTVENIMDRLEADFGHLREETAPAS